VEAISVNPVDTKRRHSAHTRGGSEVLGWDAAGTVEAVGAAVTLFKPGDRVFYAGSLLRPGSNSELQLVDERIVGPWPVGLSAAEAAAIPLTGLTASESLFERLGISILSPESEKSLLIIGGAGGVGSIAIQLAKIAGLRVVATASRPDSISWCRGLGADEVVSHEAIRKAEGKDAESQFDYILNTQDTAEYWEATARLIRPEGKICSIVESKVPVDLTLLMGKSASFTWELMFTKSLFGQHLIRQHLTLSLLSRFLERSALRSTLSQTLGKISPRGLEQGHALLESRKAVGKVVLGGWE
jgi:zinc-binding alcohol dehydrogenase family protein